MGGILKNADDAPVFTDGDPLSATAMNVLRDTIIAVDEASRLGGYAFTGLYGQHPEENDEQFWVIWRGGFVFLTGVTTLRIVTSTSGIVGGAVLRVYRGDNGANNALPATYNDLALSAGTQTHSITISAAGYTHGDPVRVQIELRHVSDPAPPYTAALVDVQMVEVLPVALSSPAWPGAPTFAGNGDVTAAKLNQLGACADWLVERCSLRYDPLFILNLRRVGPFRDSDGTSDQNVRWYGGLRRTAHHTTLSVKGRALVRYAGASETITLRLNGTLVATFAVPSAVGEYAWSFSPSISGYADGSLIAIQLRYERAAPSFTGTPVNRWTINEVTAVTPSGTGEIVVPWQIRQAAVADSSLWPWLATLSAIATSAYNRINANGGFWGVQRAFTARPASGDDNFLLFEPWGIPATWRRTSEVLVGRGRGLSIGYGPGYFDEVAFAKEAATNGGIGAYPVINNKTAPFIDGDNVETVSLYLDTVPGLPVGAAYNVRGGESYVLFEKLKVVD